MHYESIFALTISMFALTSLAVFAVAKAKCFVQSRNRGSLKGSGKTKAKCFVQSRNRGTLKGSGKTTTKGKRITQKSEKKMTTDTDFTQSMVKMVKSAWARRVLLVIRTLATSTLTQPACDHFSKAKEDRLSSAAPSLEREVIDHPPHPPGNLSSPRAPLSPKPKTDAAIAAADVKPVNAVGVQQGLLTLFVLLVVAAMIGSFITTGIKTRTIIVDTAAAHGDGECRTEMDHTCNYDTGIETLPKGLGASFPYGLLKYAVLGTTADPNAFPTAAPLLQMDTHAAVLPQTISYPAPLAPAYQSRSTMAAEEQSPPNEAGALASNVLLQTASDSPPSARNAAQVSTTIVHCSA
jgi:hypothetical protein